MMTEKERVKRFLMFLSLQKDIKIIERTVSSSPLYYTPLCYSCEDECPYMNCGKGMLKGLSCLRAKQEDFKVIVKRYPLIFFVLHARAEE